MKKMFAWIGLLSLPVILLGVYFGYFYSIEKEFVFDGLVRKYRIHRPYLVNSSTEMPLVLTLHGYGDNPRLMEMYTGWSKKADVEKFIVVYPYGTNSPEDPKLSWNAGSCCGEAVDRSVDDVGFLNSLISEIVGKYPVDEEKIFVTGFSNGALMSYRFAAQIPDRINAVGVVSGAIGGKRSQDKELYHIPTPPSKVKVILFHGDRDLAVPYEGGHNDVLGRMSTAQFTSFAQAVEFWTTVNSCTGSPEIKVTENYERIKFTNCLEESQVEAWTAKNRSHVWTGGILEFVVEGSIKGPPTTNLMWEFFTGE